MDKILRRLKVSFYKRKRYFNKIRNRWYWIFNRTFDFLGLLYRSLRYKNVYFFDTNFFITREPVIDKRLSKLHLLSSHRFMTEHINKETREKLKDVRFRRIDKAKYRVISYNDLYSLESRICPVYYNFIGTMHNPAVLFTSEFILQLLFAKIIKKRPFSAIENKLHTVVMTRLINQANSKFNEGGKIKTEFEQVLDDATIRSLKKRKDGLRGKNKNYPNDIRNLALIFTYAILFRANVTFVTADSDAIPLFFDWTSSLIQQTVFNVKCLELLSANNDTDKKALLKGKVKAYFFDANELRKFIQGTFQRFCSNRKKYFAPRVTIKYWDTHRQKYFEVGINIDKYVRTTFLHLHGSLNCPSTRNDLLGCFIAYRYWPPTPHSNVVKILPRLKKIHTQSLPIPPAIHDQNCVYRRRDLSDNFDGFSSFTL